MPRPVVRAGFGVLAVGGVYGAAVRPWMLRWGARCWEADHEWPGDDVVDAPRATSTRAITIDAGARDVWDALTGIGTDRTPGMVVARTDPPFSLVLRSRDDRASCAFVVVPLTPWQCRLIVRRRSDTHYVREPLQFVRDRRLLRCIRDRVTAPSTSQSADQDRPSQPRSIAVTAP